MKTRTFHLEGLLDMCKRTINMITIDTIKEAIEFQCYRLDLECFIIDPCENQSYQRPIAIIPSISLNKLSDILYDSDNLKPDMIDVLVLPITKKIENKFYTTIGGRAWSANKFTSMSAYGISFNNGDFFKDEVSHSDLKFDVYIQSNGYITNVKLIKL